MAEIQKYLRSFFGSNEDIQLSFWNYLTFNNVLLLALFKLYNIIWDLGWTKNGPRIKKCSYKKYKKLWIHEIYLIFCFYDHTGLDLDASMICFEIISTPKKWILSLNWWLELFGRNTDGLLLLTFFWRKKLCNKCGFWPVI